MYTIEEFDKQKTRVFKYIAYKKRTEYEVRTKFKTILNNDILEDIIKYLKEAGYINDYEYIVKAVSEYISLKNLSIKEIKYKLYSKGIDRKILDEYINKNEEKLKEYEKKSAQNIIKKKENSMDSEEIKRYLAKKGYNISNYT